MKPRIFLIILGLFLLVTSLQARRKPELVLEKTDYELGVINRSDSAYLTLQIPYRNAGTSRLRILRAETSCTCTTCQLSTMTLRRKGRGVLTVRVDLEELELGDVMRCVSLFADACEEPATVCFMAKIIENTRAEQDDVKAQF